MTQFTQKTQAPEDPAWIDYRNRFAETYDDLNYNGCLKTWAMNAGHKLTEKKFTQKDFFEKVLEVGAGTGHHLSFIQHQFDQYFLTDLDSKALDLAKNKLANSKKYEKFKHKIIFDIQSGAQLTYPDNSFDRVIATHILEHILEPHLVLKEWARVLKHQGILSILIPTDPGIAWRLGRHLGPRQKSINHGIAYDYAMAREHVNSCHNLIAILNHYFPTAQKSFWPLPIKSIDLNLFFVCHVQIEK